MSSRGRVVSSSLVLCTCLNFSAVVSAGTFQWAPGWQTGKYWIVRSPLIRHVPEDGGGTISERSDGYYYTRFRVLSDEVSQAGRTVVLEVRYRENADGTFDEMNDSLQITFDMTRLRVTRVRKLGIAEEGGTIDSYMSVRQGLPGMFEYDGILAVPDTLPLILPVFESCSAPSYTCELEDVTHSDPDIQGLSYSQEVTVLQGDGQVAMWGGSGGDLKQQDMQVPYLLVFKPNLPWPNVLRLDHSMQAEVVEVGLLP